MANVANPTQVRAEGHSELLGDIVIACTGGVTPAIGSTVPTTNITVTLSNTTVTSRTFGNGLSEALLLIDEPGSPDGNGLSANLCAGGALGAGAGGCSTTVQTLNIGGTNFTEASTASPATATSVPNAFQGVVSSSNQVVFTGIPVLAPVTSGYARVFRITNIRADAAPAGSGSILAGITMSGGLLLANPVQTAGNVFTGLTATVRNASNTAAGSGLSPFACGAAAVTPGAVLRFTEGFTTAFKTRISPTASLSGAATPPGSTTTATTFTQNVPNTIYSGSQSGFILPVSGGVSGLADFGTRLKAVFSHIPAGVSIYVSTTNINPLGNAGVNPASGTNLTAPATAVAAGNFTAGANVSLLAGLVTGESATSGTGGPLPLAAATTTSGGVTLYGPLPVDGNGTATATWEIFLSNPAAPEVADFAVFYVSNGSATPGASATTTLGFAPTTVTPDLTGVTPQFAPSGTTIPFLTAPTCQISLALTASPTSSSFGQPVAFTGALTTSAGVPTGSISFKDGAATLATLPVIAGRAVLTTSSLAAGTHSLTAVYSGDSNFSSVSSSPLSQQVSRAATTTSLSLSPSSVNVGQPETITALVTSSGGLPTGIVTFRDGAVVLRTAQLDGSGTARLFTSSLALGDHNITATYEGDANFSSSASASQRLSVGRFTPTVSTPVVRSGTVVLGDVLTIASTVSSDGGPATGTLTFRDGGALLGDASLDASSTGVITVKLGLGRHLITALYSGDGRTESTISGTLDLTIKATPAVTVTATPNPAAVGAAVALTATVAQPAATSIVPTGTVTFTEGATTLGSSTLSASGQATLNVPAGFTAGDHNIVAAYAGDSNYIAASSTAFVEHVNKSATATALAQGVANNAFYLTAAVAPSSAGAPTGTVQFVDVTTGAALGAAAVANNSATVSLALPLPVGHMVKASYSGDAIFAASDSAQQMFLAATNGFSFVPAFAPDAVATIFGALLSGSTEAASGLPLPATLAGVTVKFVDANGGSHPASLYYVSPGQINLVTPSDLPAGTAKLIVTTPAGPITIAVTIAASAPALTSADGSGSGAAAAQVLRLHRDGTADAPITVSPAPIAYAGDRLFLVLYGTGLRHATAPVSCSLNGQSVPALFAGAQGAYPGLDQINLELPGGLSGVVRITCSADGAPSNVVTVSVQ